MNAARHALITGGSSGIGLAVGRLLAAQGWRISLLARGRERLEAAAEALRAIAGDPAAAQPYAVDVADRTQCAQAVDAAIAASGAPDLLLACAGVVRPGYFEDIPDADFERAMAVNYFGALHAVRAALPAMRARRGGHVIFVSSGAGLIGVFGYSAYAPSKFAVRGLAEVLRAELRPAGVRVSVVYPPDTDTPQLAEEARLKPAETRAITARGGLLSADEVAREIVQAVGRDEFTIAPGSAMGLLAAWHSPLARILRWSLDRTARQAARRLPV
jgi:3-dehydrosphinganine reductase